MTNRIVDMVSPVVLALLLSLVAGCKNDESSSDDAAAGANGSNGIGGSGNDTGGASGTGGNGTVSDRPATAPSGVDCEHTGAGTDYVVGPNDDYADPGDVPWAALEAGDSVRIRWRADPYRAKVLISGQGTERQPIRVCGLAGSDGQLPVFEGESAVSAPAADWPDWQRGGVFVIDKADSHGESYQPSHIIVEGFEIRGVNQNNSHENTDGTTYEWGDGAAGIVIYRGQGVTLRGNVLHDNSQGVFSLAKGGGAALVEDVLIEGNHLYDNGTPGSHFEHHSYIQGARTTYQYNRYGDMKSGAGGAAIKDRATGTIVRYNWIAGGSHAVDLVEPQEHYEDVESEPDYDVAYVYGNAIDIGPTGSLVHFGGENAQESMRKGPVYVYYNTVYREAADDEWRTTLFDVTHPDAVMYLYNNVLVRTGGRSDGPGAQILFQTGNAVVGTNLITSPWREAHEQTFSGTVEGTESLIVTDSPGVDPETLRLEPGSPAIGAAAELPPELDALPVDMEYVDVNEARPRTDTSDLGAFDFEG